MTDHQTHAENQYPHPGQATAAFEARLRGQLIHPQDPGYEAARRVYNGMIDRRPQLIARCVDVADVVATVNFARDNELPLAIRGGGHNVAGFGTCDDGLVLEVAACGSAAPTCAAGARGRRLGPTTSCPDTRWAAWSSRSAPG